MSPVSAFCFRVGRGVVLASLSQSAPGLGVPFDCLSSAGSSGNLGFLFLLATSRRASASTVESSFRRRSTPSFAFVMLGLALWFWAGRADRAVSHIPEHGFRTAFVFVFELRPAITMGIVFGPATSTTGLRAAILRGGGKRQLSAIAE